MQLVKVHKKPVFSTCLFVQIWYNVECFYSSILKLL